MAIKFSETVRNARLDAIESAIGTSPKMRIYDGTIPSGGCGDPAAGTLLLTINLPSDWMANAGSGAKILTGTWPATVVSTGGTPQYFRIYDSSNTVCHMQGTIGLSSGDLSFDDTALTTSKTVTITGFTLTDGNA